MIQKNKYNQISSSKNNINESMNQVMQCNNSYFNFNFILCGGAGGGGVGFDSVLY